MLNVIKNNTTKIFNQLGINEFKNSCTLQVQWWILSDMFGFTMDHDQKVNMIDSAVADGSLSKRFGAYFANIYPFVCREIEDITGFKFVAKKVSVHSSKFTRLASRMYSFWLWNKRPTYAYLEKLKDDYVLSKNDILQIVKPVDSGIDHNTRWSAGYIIESLNVPKPVECTINTLKYAAGKGLFWSWAWYLEPVIEWPFDTYVFDYLQGFKIKSKDEIKKLTASRPEMTDIQRDAYDAAYRIKTNLHTGNLKSIKELRAKHI